MNFDGFWIGGRRRGLKRGLHEFSIARVCRQRLKAHRRKTVSASLKRYPDTKTILDPCDVELRNVELRPTRALQNINDGY